MGGARWPRARWLVAARDGRGADGEPPRYFLQPAVRGRASVMRRHAVAPLKESGHPQASVGQWFAVAASADDANDAQLSLVDTKAQASAFIARPCPGAAPRESSAGPVTTGPLRTLVAGRLTQGASPGVSRPPWPR